ncbi:MAG: HEAT repeat domain-containing protein, partial [Verrucomicrobia bacterium]|nr:HEAT repeat domain-containing protein [Verrucomicrobiota bacterium]
MPDGFQMRLFASEPMVVNPVAMTWDDRGRLWVLELYEYPLGAKPGATPRDRIKILEDTDNDGRADKVTVFADGFSLATGLLWGNGGVYLGQAPHFMFLEDTNHDDKVDRKTILKTGFGMEDRHELLNGFTWGPDGYLYLTHGVFTRSQVKDPSNPADTGVVVTAAIARFHPKTRRFEVFSDGTSNPWGVDFDARGQAFVSACVIDHLFHIAPGGLYQRQAGQPVFPYAYELLPSIVDHRHHMAAYAGIQIYQGSQYPPEYLGAAIMGNIHDNSIHWDRLTPAGSSFKASFVRDFVRANDGWFMPVSTQTGPDDCLWIMDWYDRYPCYQNANADPDGVDRERGRIWRLVHVGKETRKPMPSRPETNMDLSRLSSPDLVKLLAGSNSWQRRVAQRLLSERGETAFGARRLHGGNPLDEMYKKGPSATARLSALWALHGAGLLEDEQLDVAADAKEPALREWAARLTGERGLPFGDAMKRLGKLASDADPGVRLAVAVAARQFVSSSLTLDTPPAIPLREVVTGGVLSGLYQACEKSTDPTLSFLFWMALEPIVAYDPYHAADFFKGYKGEGDTRRPFAAMILNKIMRRACDLRDEAVLSKVVAALGEINEKETGLLAQGLQGLIEGQRGKTLLPDASAKETVARLSHSAHADVSSKAQQLGSLWGDAASLRANIDRTLSPATPDADRIAGIRALSGQKTEDIREVLLRIARSPGADAVRVEAVRGLGAVGHDSIGERLLAQWDQSSPAVRRAASELMSTREAWISQFLKACKSGAVKRGDVPPTVVRNLSTHKNDIVRLMAQDAWGRFSATGPDKLKLIAEKRKVVVQGPIDVEAGHQVAKKACLICHTLHGEGGQVGPDLTGVGRSSLDALLHNVINPNEIIGQGYENVEVETKDGRTLGGRMMENTDIRVRLMSVGGQEEVIAKSDIASLRVTANSVMPEGLEQMPDADFRNLIWYILAPPQDGRPLTEERKKELINVGGDQASVSPASDGESIALWIP